MSERIQPQPGPPGLPGSLFTLPNLSSTGINTETGRPYFLGIPNNTNVIIVKPGHQFHRRTYREVRTELRELYIRSLTAPGYQPPAAPAAPPHSNEPIPVEPTANFLEWQRLENEPAAPPPKPLVMSSEPEETPGAIYERIRARIDNPPIAPTPPPAAPEPNIEEQPLPVPAPVAAIDPNEAATKRAGNAVLGLAAAAGNVINNMNIFSPSESSATVVQRGGWPSTAEQDRINSIRAGTFAAEVAANTRVPKMGDTIIPFNKMQTGGQGTMPPQPNR